MEDSTLTTKRSTTQRRRLGWTADRGLYCEDVDWLLNCADSVLGEIGTLGGMIAVVELGGPAPGGMPETWRYSTERLVAVARARRLQLIWRNVPRDSRGYLLAHYATRSMWPPGMVGHLGRLAGVALASHTGKAHHRLIRACCEGNAKILNEARDKADRLIRAAHADWHTAAVQHATDAWVEPKRFLAAYAGHEPEVSQMAWDTADHEDETMVDCVDALEGATDAA